MSDIQRIAEVLRTASGVGYASERPQTQKDPDGTHRIEFRIGETHYKDEWWGGNPFSGQESVALGGKVVWAAQYRGSVETGQDVHATYEFLKAALRQPSDFYRGPETYKAAGLRYFNEQTGGLEAFMGTERISKGSKKVYVCHYLGGLVDL